MPLLNALAQYAAEALKLKQIDNRQMTAHPAYGRFNVNPYLRLIRLHRPSGLFLLVWPGWISLALAGNRSILAHLIFFAGAFLMRGAGCAINDFWDKDVDAKTERTKTRPLAAGELTRKKALLCAATLALAACLLLPFLPFYARMIAVLLAPMAALYPLAKRYVAYPQAALAFTFGGGALMGDVTATGQGISIAGLLTYGACVFWIFGYDTVYAFQDIEDDLRNGARSSAITLGRHARAGVRVSYLASFFLFIAAGYCTDAGPTYFAGCAAFAALSAVSVWLEERGRCRPGTAFALHAVAGAPIWAGAILGG